MSTTRSIGSTVLAALAVVGLSACGSSTNSSSTASSTQPPAVTASADAGDTATPATATAQATVTVTATATATDGGASSETGSTTGSSATATQRATSGSSTSTSTGSTGARTLDVDITKRSQVDTKLAGTSASFRAFIAKQFDKEVALGSCSSGTHVMVEKYWASDRMATGGITSCGGANTFWWKGTDGAWHEYGFQGVGSCAGVKAEGVPTRASKAGLKCLAKDGSTVTYGAAA